MNSTNLSPTGSWYKYVQISLSQEPVQICTSLYLTRELVPICTLYNSLPHRALVQICTSLNLTRSRYKYVPTVPISLSPEAGLNLYKSLSHRIQYQYVQISLSQEAATIGISLYLTRSRHQYVQLSLSPKSKSFAPALLPDGVSIFIGIFP